MAWQNAQHKFNPPDSHPFVFAQQRAHACFAWIEWLNRRAWYKISLLRVAFLHLADKYVLQYLYYRESFYAAGRIRCLVRCGGYINAGYSAAATGKLNLSLAGDGIANSKAALMASVLCQRSLMYVKIVIALADFISNTALTEHFTALTDFSLLIRTSKWGFHPIDVYLIGKPQRECNHQSIKF